MRETDTIKRKTREEYGLAVLARRRRGEIGVNEVSMIDFKTEDGGPFFSLCGSGNPVC